MFPELSERGHLQNCFTLKRGRILFKEGQNAGFAFVLRVGKVRLTMLPDKRRGVRVLYPFAVMGLSACLAGGKYDATAEVVEDAELAVAPRNEVMTFLRNSPAAALSAVEVLSDDVYRAYERLRQFRSELGRDVVTW